MNTCSRLGLLAICLSLTGPLRAAEEPPDLTEIPLELAPKMGLPFGDNAVLQQQIPIPVWGWSLPGAEVVAEFDQQRKSAVAGEDGRWQVTLDAMPADRLVSLDEAPPGRTLTITSRHQGKEASIKLHNLLVGEVWLCAGQSNIGGKLGRGAAGSKLPDGSVLTGNYPAMRQMISPSAGPWVVCTPETVGLFKKVGFYFGHPVQKEIRVPIGIISASVGGSNIESWMNQPALPGSHYETQIAPIASYAIRGTIWYQGEANAKDGHGYLPKMRSLIEGWREVWKQGDFPFYFVQIASIGESPADQPAGGDGRAGIRNAQFQALALPHTGMAVTIDIGDRKEHPRNKYDVGLRLARWALHRDYGQTGLVPSGPLYKSHAIEGKTIRVKFDHAQNGLMLAQKEGYAPPVPTPDAPMPWLSIQARDGTWHWAQGRIDGPDLIVSSKEVSHPIAVRYAYTQFPAGCNLYNTDGLPASPFSTADLAAD
jgi:sialate O-acetylesterase